MEYRKIIQKIFYPNVCPICNQVIGMNQRICKECRDKIKIVKTPACQMCGKQLTSNNALYCQDCAKTKHEFNKGVCVFQYVEEMKLTLYRFKYDNKRCYGDFFAYVGNRKYRSKLKQWKIDRIMPIPMYKGKVQQRGYNQAEEFAKYLSRYSNITLDKTSLIRVSDTKPQKGLSRSQRSSNLKNAFAIKPETLKGVKSVLLVDDIYTTGSTMDACSRLLKSAGVKDVYFMCIATGIDK